MIYSAEISNGVHWVGVNDRLSQFFERMWPLDEGVAYNSYLIVDEKSVLIDTVSDGTGTELLARIEDLLQDKPLCYLVINHMEPDHTGALPLIVSRWPQLTILGNKKTKQILDTYYPDLANFEEIKDATQIELGQHTIQFHLTPWVHWPETMMTYEVSSKTLFSGDAFGTFGALNGGIFDDEIDATRYEDQMRRYYACIVGKYSKMVQKALAKLKPLDVATIASTHGPVWRSNPAWVIDKYDKWSRHVGEKGVVLAVGSMYGSTLALAEYLTRGLVKNGVRNVRFYDVSKTHMSYIVADVWKYRGLLLGSVAYNAEMFPLMQSLCNELLHIAVSNKYLGLFGGCSWNGGGVKSLTKFAEASGLELIGEPVEMYGHPSQPVLEKADLLAKSLAEKVLAEEE